ncbi:MAG TPA: kynureninase [Phycisphaerales bacterium]|nr:kynureninase [Phycisphaerales bacterium]HMP37233.1 kynureninase [Phycisphaerales bacterium]
MPSPSSIDEVNVASFAVEREFARHLDAIDALAPMRERFHLPSTRDGRPATYFCGNSLGLMPRDARGLVEQELDDWAGLAVEAHFHGRTPWYSYHEVFRETGARLVGARPGEVVMMNSLTVNLHLLLTSFYRPRRSGSGGAVGAGERDRVRVLMEDGAFPSDTYAIKSHLAARGVDCAEALVLLRPRDGEQTLRTEDIESTIAAQGERLATVILGGVNFRTGQVLDMQRIVAAAHGVGATCGFDLAHAAGNIPLALHDWDVDFACWCSYKYLNAGPGAIAGAFVHERHGADASIPRLAGWWGNDPDSRFRMHLEPEFVPRRGADGWQLSNPPILAMAPLRASLALFDEAGMPALRRKSLVLTAYLEFLLRERMPADCRIITPADPGERGCQLSIQVLTEPRARFDALEARGVICDFRPPDVIRVAPVPLYNRFVDVWEFAEILRAG